MGTLASHAEIGVWVQAPRGGGKGVCTLAHGCAGAGCERESPSGAAGPGAITPENV